MTLRPGLCSVTFRQRTPDEILGLVTAAGLAAVEWGADVHVPPGSADAAGLARRCADVGVACPSYGTYHFAGSSTPDELPALFDTAAALAAGTLRIWCEWGVEPGCPAGERRRVTDAVAAVGAAAAGRGLTVGLEHHPGTLTATAASTVQLLDDVGSADVRSYWQPRPGDPPHVARAELALVRDRLAHVHVFWWEHDRSRLPLADGAELWQPVVADLATDGVDRCAYLEFVAGDDPDALAADAATLRGWLP